MKFSGPNAHIHDRMPVLLPLRHDKYWLPPNPTSTFVFPDFAPELLTSYRVPPRMNRASYNEPDAIAPLEAALAT
jgi:putative SOS response-associated peptidase YedK